ncbi:hypothetical protein PENTCL1PPCAC_5750, partial [Pristionchus entomophagus]
PLRDLNLLAVSMDDHRRGSTRRVEVTVVRTDCRRSSMTEASSSSRRSNGGVILSDEDHDDVIDDDVKSSLELPTPPLAPSRQQACRATSPALSTAAAASPMVAHGRQTEKEEEDHHSDGKSEKKGEAMDTSCSPVAGKGHDNGRKREEERGTEKPRPTAATESSCDTCECLPRPSHSDMTIVRHVSTSIDDNGKITVDMPKMLRLTYVDSKKGAAIDQQKKGGSRTGSLASVRSTQHNSSSVSSRFPHSSSSDSLTSLTAFTCSSETGVEPVGDRRRTIFSRLSLARRRASVGFKFTEATRMLQKKRGERSSSSSSSSSSRRSEKRKKKDRKSVGPSGRSNVSKAKSSGSEDKTKEPSVKREETTSEGRIKRAAATAAAAKITAQANEAAAKPAARPRKKQQPVAAKGRTKTAQKKVHFKVNKKKSQDF